MLHLLQHMDYVGFIDAYHVRIKMFHVKDAEFQRSARSGVYGVTRTGLVARAGSAALATDKSISARSSHA